MWYAATAVADDPQALPVSLDQAKARLRIEFADDDDLLADLLREAAAVVATYCGLRLMPQTVTARCDGFSAFAKLPEGPAIAEGILDIRYVDQAGAEQVLPPSSYELRVSGLDAQILPVGGASWPAHRLGELVTVRFRAGFNALPFEIQAAILLRVDAAYHGREPPPTGEFGAFDALLVDYRRGG